VLKLPLEMPKWELKMGKCTVLEILGLPSVTVEPSNSQAVAE
jgi:hypothetical protein